MALYISSFQSSSKSVMKWKTNRTFLSTHSFQDRLRHNLSNLREIRNFKLFIYNVSTGALNNHTNLCLHNKNLNSKLSVATSKALYEVLHCVQCIGGKLCKRSEITSA